MSSKSNIHDMVEHLTHTPLTELIDREFATNIVMFGSYASIIKNKQLTMTTLITEIIQDEQLEKDFCEHFSCESLRVALGLIFNYNPHLAKSKSIKDNIKKRFNNGVSKRKKLI